MPLDEPKPLSAEVQHLEELRLAPSEETWRLEIEVILDGFRDVIIEHRGDAGGYVEDLLGQAKDPSACRIAFQGALERQVEQWKPPRGLAEVLELIRRFVPNSGFPRLVELFRSQRSFSSDPPLNEPEFLGRDLRLNALHALERYFPVAPLFGEEGGISRPRSQAAFAAYMSILREHLQYQRYKPYTLRILERLIPSFLGNIKDIALSNSEARSSEETHGSFVTELRSSQISEPLEVVVYPGEELSDAKLYAAALLAPMRGSQALGSLYESFLAGGTSTEKEFRVLMKKHHRAIVRYDKKGPVVTFADSSKSDIKIWVPRNLYHFYYPIYIQQTPRSIALKGAGGRR